MGDAMNAEHRPSHPDLLALGEIIAEFDQGGDTTKDGIAEVIDPMSVVYVAHSRAKRFSDIPAEINAMGPLWVEGFLAGVEWQKRRA
ncbi:hypothetical protein JRC04_05080 [Mycolicibacterium sp. S2-37]|uniref:hypothetical protein n=1 Tax=Mycolicibacterium sp. S2-37 TaxID=2810297 RepID=UPI001A94CE5B|nr:hypothetical protein [Mycolicibacterium sp. S2-37]MBO0676831.1 hypothetical protein [Mycolicibacterium sp. S2-37]